MMRNGKNSALPANAGKPWDHDEDRQLLAMVKQHKSQKQMANQLERTTDDVFWRVADLLIRHAPSAGL